MLRRGWAALTAAVLVLSVTFAAGGQSEPSDPLPELLLIQTDLAEAMAANGEERSELEAMAARLVAVIASMQATTTTVATTTTPTTTTSVPPATTTTTPPTTTTVAPPSTCTGVQVAAGANLVTVANAHPAGTTFCLAAGIYNLAGTPGMPLQTGDAVIGARGPNGERLSILNGGFNAAKALTCTCSPALIANIIVEQFSSAIQSQPFGPGLTGATWDNIESRFNEGRGFFTFNGTTLRDSYIHHNQQLGIGGNGDNVLVDNVEVAFNNPDGEIMPGFEAGGSKWTNAVGVTVTGSYFHHNCGAGIWFDGSGNSNITITDNVTTDNWSPGIFIELLGSNATVSGNTVLRNTFGNAGPICANTPGGDSSGAGNGGIRANGSHDVEIFDNVVADNDGGISATQDDRRSVVDIDVHDNEISYTVGWTGIQKTGGTADPFSAGANNHFSSNAYTTDVAKPFKWGGADRTWVEWQGFGHDLTGTFNS